MTMQVQFSYPSLPTQLTLEQMSMEDFKQFVKDNPTLRCERTAEGQVLVMPPTGGFSGYYESEATGELRRWSKSHGGMTFSSSTGFFLSPGEVRFPDAAWINAEKAEAFMQADDDGFVKYVPDFVIEIRSKTDTLSELQTKMQRYLDSGVTAAWLIDPYGDTTYAYRSGREVRAVAMTDVLQEPEVLPGFELQLKDFRR